MNSVQTIPLVHLIFAFVPVVIVVGTLHWWSLDSKNAVYALTRMLVQLLLIGYVLTFIFETESASVVIGVLALMLLISSWISLRALRNKNRLHFLSILGSIALGGIFTLVLVTQAVLDLNPWFAPRYMIPLAGMIFANAMNTVSLAAERYESERETHNHIEARQTALRAAMIPLINSLFAVGLVALPGMMTGQILSGVSPLVAARYQIVVMCMIFGSAGISAVCYLILVERTKFKV
ncbi:MAG: ABC transporter permease [Arenicellales bacterium]|nr:ABC transporter permease [Arenicellales bacterium]